MIYNSFALRYKFAFFRILEHLAFPKEITKYFQSRKNHYHYLAQAELAKNTGRIKQIKRESNISTTEFKKKYLDKGIPVILTGFANNWPALKEWTPNKLAKRFGDDQVSLIDTNGAKSKSLDYDIEQTDLRTVLQAMENGDATKYSRFNRLLYDHPELLNDFDSKWLYKMRCKISSGKTFQVFLGAKGTKTQLHAASEHNLFTQVYGKKHWYIMSPKYDIALNPPVTGAPYFYTQLDPDAPDLEAFPHYKNMEILECTLEPGDVLYNPPSYWHHVTNLTASIGVGFRWFGAVDCFKLNFSQALLTILSTNPPIWVATKHRTNFPKIFNYMKEKNKS